MPRLMITGHGRHGKDTVAEIIREELGLTFESSSAFCCRKFIYDSLKNVMGYQSLEECFEDRFNLRSLWHKLICAYNRKDPARLSREIFSEHDIYVGIRSGVEFLAAKEEGLFDLSIWVDASDRVEEEGDDSFDLDIRNVDVIIPNNGTEDELRVRILSMISAFSLDGAHKHEAFRLCNN